MLSLTEQVAEAFPKRTGHSDLRGWLEYCFGTDIAS